MKRWEEAQATQRLADRLKKMRLEIQDVLQNEEKDEIQKTIVNEVFMAYALHLETAVEKQLKIYFDAAARRPDDKFAVITKMLTTPTSQDPNDPKAIFTPVLSLGLGINPQFLNLEPSDLKAMPGYIQLHEVMRRFDVAVKVVGLTLEEKQPGQVGGQTILYVDLTKTYAEGANWNPGFYPDLPERKKEAEKPFEIREKILPKKNAKPPGNNFNI